MSRRLHRGGLALAACLIVTLAAACSSSSSTSRSSSSSSANHGTLIVFGAGTLATPFAAEIAAFKKANPGVTVHSQFAASGDMVRKITQLHQPADVLGVADYSLIPKLMFTANAAWYLGFVSNAITFAYTSHSKGASGLTSSNWYKVLAQPGVHIGRSNPAADPSGYQTLQMLQLANSYYKDPGLSASVLKNSPAASVAETETSLISALQSGADRLPGDLQVHRARAAPEIHRAAAADQPVRSGDGRRLRQGVHSRRVAGHAECQADHLRADHPGQRTGCGAG
jgi:molybdate/tungstate transport system substrate-binding protein